MMAATMDRPAAADAFEVVMPVPEAAPKAPTEHRQHGRVAARWAVRDAAGRVLHLVARFNGEDGGKRAVLPLVYGRDGAGRLCWRWQAPPSPRPIYGLDRLAARPEAPVMVTEGEKAADAAASLLPDHAAVTSTGGAGAAAKSDWSPLRSRRVTICPDADEAGARYADDVARLALEAGAAEVRIVDLAALAPLPAGFDLADPLPPHLDAAAIRAAVEGAPRWRSEAVAAAASDGWGAPDLDVLDPPLPPPPPFPLDALGAWAGWVTEAAEAAGAPVDYAAMALLGGAATAIGAGRWARAWGDFKQPAVLWLAVVGAPSSGKSPALSPVRRVIADLEAEAAAGFGDLMRQHEEAAALAEMRRADWEAEARAERKALREPPPLPADATAPPPPVRPRLLIDDATIERVAGILAAEPRGCGMIADELAAWLGGFDRYGGGGDRAVWLSAYDAARRVIDRVKRPEPLIVPAFAVTIVGAIQPERLVEALTDTVDDGLAARFAYAWPEPVSRGRSEARADLDRLAAALRLLRALPLDAPAYEGGPPLPRVLTLDPSAAEVLDALRQDAAESCAAAVGLASGSAGKAAGLALRLGLILTLMDWAGRGGVDPEPTSIAAAAMVRACTLVDLYFRPMLARVVAAAGESLGESDARRLARWLRRHPAARINLRDVRRSPDGPGIGDAERLRAAADALCEAGWLRRLAPASGKATGRPRLDYEVNPRLGRAR